jgi:hypothetical protein
MRRLCIQCCQLCAGVCQTGNTRRGCGGQSHGLQPCCGPCLQTRRVRTVANGASFGGRHAPLADMVHTVTKGDRQTINGRNFSVIYCLCVCLGLIACLTEGGMRQWWIHSHVDSYPCFTRRLKARMCYLMSSNRDSCCSKSKARHFFVGI